MVEVRLHGVLAQKFGKVWNFDIGTPREAVDAIEANKPGFKAAVLDLERRGMCFRVSAGGHDYSDDDVNRKLGSFKRVDIVPLVMGASAGVRFVTGAVLVAAGLYVGGPIGTALVSTGASLMIGSVAEWLTPIPKKEDMAKSLQSWTLNGPTNTVEQGYPVPIIYGEVLTGGYTISAGISVSQLDSAAGDAPLATVGGEVDSAFYAVNDTDPIVGVIQLTVGTVNLQEPFTYSWSYSGFSGATSVSMDGADTATIRLTLTGPARAAGTSLLVTGNVSVTVNGRVPDPSGSGTIPGSATKLQAISAYFSNTASA